MGNRQTGFTLIEIAIVLVIIGLLLGGVLKGQELITGARVRNLIQQQDGVKAAYFGFLDRYKALPGDYSGAAANITGATGSGDGDGQIEAGAESILAWEHLAKSGFINGSYVANGATTPTDANNPKNPYAGYMQLIYDGVYGTGTSTTPAGSRHNLKTGPNIPVEIVGELDRKVDDGSPYTGAFQFSPYAGGGTAPTGEGTGGCVTAAVAGTAPVPAGWNVAGGSANCGGASLY
ncbi:MAG TPA: prepilin-type N-terminal cleavage/methylation domain-containing protein [Burkholderiales bacterium]|nr:prepilin-type N-terminal cleavage/methylation domain-containing protein [Burkholderiales bacterium]